MSGFAQMLKDVNEFAFIVNEMLLVGGDLTICFAVCFALQGTRSVSAIHSIRQE
jgi:hypothetical protein